MFPHCLSHNGVVWEIGGEYPERFSRLDDVIVAAETRAPKLTDAYWDNLSCGLFLGWITPYQSEMDAAIARASQQQRLDRLKAKAREANAMRDEFRKKRFENENRAGWLKTLKRERW